MRSDLASILATVTASSLSQAERRAVWLARLCAQALIAEAELTPKPGLVDRRGAGSHNDLSLSIMRRSALAIEPYFYQMALLSSRTIPSQALREHLAAIGREAERAMYRITGGSNAHKGAIWILGLLASAAAITDTDTTATRITETAKSIATFHDGAMIQLVTHGHVVARMHGVKGARGEALEGFPHVVHVGLPTLRARRIAGAPESVARIDTLLSIMSRLEDTCVLYRGKAAALETLQFGARNVLAAGGYESKAGKHQLQQLDDDLLTLRVSPGGSADLLAATLFIDAVERGQNEVQEDRSWSEVTDGTN